VPGRAAYLNGRGGSSMQLNFSGVDDAAIREGVRRIGEVVREQVDLYGTLTGRGAPRADAEPAPSAPDPELADVLELPRRGDQGERRAR
jgi:2-aminoadipate transaminase